MAVINVQNWSVEQVMDWITGLSPSLSQYTETFTSKQITGQKLLNLMQGDLDYLLGITRIGDQLLLHNAIQTLRDELQTPWTTLQTLALALSVRCKNYRSELTQQKQAESEALQKLQQQAQQLSQQSDDHHSNHHHHHHYHHHPYQKTNPSSTAKSNSYNHNSSPSSSSHHHHNNVNSSSSSSSGSSNNTQNSSASSSQQTGAIKLDTIPTTSLASASYLLDAGKVLIRWLTRFPFLGKLDYDEISRKLSKHCFELAVLSQRDTFADNAIEEVQYLCTKIIELCEALIHSKDSLVIQPAGIDIITLRKRNEQDWGLQFESSYWGLHQITGVKLSSPAQQSGHLERGDEILQVNYQTVLAWPQPSVISLLHENENEVILTVKRRPRHASTNLLLIGGGNNNNMYLTKVPNRKSFFERKAKEELRSINRLIASGGGTPGSSIIISSSIVEVVEDNSGSSDLVSESSVHTLQLPEEKEGDGGKKTEQPAATQSPQRGVQNNDDEKAAVRFWKLYPKPKYLIKRRATVTGASPTETRPPVTFIHETNTPRCYDDNSSSSDTSTNHHNPEYPPPPTSKKPNPHQQVHHRRSTPVGSSSSNQPNGNHSPLIKMQLLNPPTPTSRPPLDKSRSAPEAGGEDEEVQVGYRNKQDDDDDTDSVLVAVLDDDEVFGRVVSEEVVRPTPKPRASKSSVGSLKKQENFEVDGSVLVAVKEQRSRDDDVKPEVTVVQQQQATEKTTQEIGLPEQPPTPEQAPTPPPRQIKSILHQGILHIRSQLRKQSSSNSASALPVIGLNSSLNNSNSPTLLSSSSPRWIRQNAVFYSTRELEIVNPVGGSGRGNKEVGQQAGFNVQIADIAAVGGLVRKEEFSVLPASEVHSRPFAFKITSGDSVTYYLAAESQPELDTWIHVLTTGEVSMPTRSSNMTSNRARNASTSSPGSSIGGDTGRRNFARAPYKRSISLGSSNNNAILSSSSQNIHTSTPPPPTQQAHSVLTRSTNNLYNRPYAYSTSSTTNLIKSPQQQHRPHTTSSADSYSRSLLNRSKSSSLKTDWFLRSGPSSPQSTNISSITITSKKVKTQVSAAATQYPTPTSTPTKQQQCNSNQPMMGVTMKTKKNSVSSTSPTRKYMCPNCCNVVKVDMGTQTGEGSVASPIASPQQQKGEVKLVFFDNGGESRV